MIREDRIDFFHKDKDGRKKKERKVLLKDEGEMQKTDERRE